MISNISFGSMFNPERTKRRHIEGSLINPENNIERLNVHQKPSGKITTTSEEEMEFGKIGKTEPLFLSPSEILGKVQIQTQNFKTSKPEEKNISIFESEAIDCTSKYSIDELEEIINRFENKEMKPVGSDYEVIFYSDLNRLVINHGSESRNYTTVIFSDGSAKQIGCYKETDVAETGSCLDIIESAKKRINKN